MLIYACFEPSLHVPGVLPSQAAQVALDQGFTSNDCQRWVMRVFCSILVQYMLRPQMPGFLSTYTALSLLDGTCWHGLCAAAICAGGGFGSWLRLRLGFHTWPQVAAGSGMFERKG